MVFRLINDFDPVSVRVADKIKIHFRIFKTDAPHFLMQPVRFFFILHAHGKMDLVFTQVIGFFVIAEPCELQQEARAAVSKEGELKSAILIDFPFYYGKTKRFLIKIDAFSRSTTLKLKWAN